MSSSQPDVPRHELERNDSTDGADNGAIMAGHALTEGDSHKTSTDSRRASHDRPPPLSPRTIDEEKQAGGGDPVAIATDTDANDTALSGVTRVLSVQENRDSIFSKREKAVIVSVAAFASIFSSISSPIYLPAFSEIEKSFGVTANEINQTVTVYSVFQGISPMIWGALADSIGRRPVYFMCFAVYIGANIGLALSPSYWVMFGMRMLQASGAAVTVALVSGVVGDITTRRDRGMYMGITSGVGLIGNCFGPLIGGGLTSGLGWRSVFWFLLIGGSLALLLLFFFYPETNRFIVKDGSVYPGWLNWSPYIYLRSRTKGVPDRHASQKSLPVRKISILRGLRLLRWFDVWLILIPASLHYTTWFMAITAQSTLLTKNYSFDSTQVGLSYLASGGGSIFGSVVSGRMMNLWYRRQVKQFQDECLSQGQEVHMSQFNIQKARLGLAIVPSAIHCVAVLVFGWTIDKRVHYIVPILMTFFISWASVTFINTTSTLLVDLFPDDSASATAVVNLTRCLLCACGLAAVDRMIAAMSPGGAFTFMGALSLASMVLIFFELRIGRSYDQKRRARMAAATPLPQ